MYESELGYIDCDSLHIDRSVVDIEDEIVAAAAAAGDQWATVVVYSLQRERPWERTNRCRFLAHDPFHFPGIALSASFVPTLTIER